MSAIANETPPVRPGPRFSEAIAVAAELHAQQRRKRTGIPIRFLCRLERALITLALRDERP